MKNYKEIRATAYREAIADQTEEFYKGEHDKRCVKCVFRKGNTVDHKTTTFSSLVREFESEWGYLEGNICKSNHSWYRYKFDDSDLMTRYMKEDWQQFHREKADYQLLCSSCNSMKGR